VITHVVGALSYAIAYFFSAHLHAVIPGRDMGGALQIREWPRKGGRAGGFI
jgi:hypothetical protein